MYTRHTIGKYGEDVAVRYLMQKGYRIIERNFYCRQGEIDIIASCGDDIVFVEVKTRSNLLYGNPAEAVNANKQKHMYKVAKFYLHVHRWEERFVRFDVIEVNVGKGIAKVNHIKQIM